jgi:hypothetical protein
MLKGGTSTCAGFEFASSSLRLGRICIVLSGLGVRRLLAFLKKLGNIHIYRV